MKWFNLVCATLFFAGSLMNILNAVKLYLLSEALACLMALMIASFFAILGTNHAVSFYRRASK